MAKIKFERLSAPTGSVEFTRNPSQREGHYQRTVKYLQPKEYSDGGVLYSYNKGIVQNTKRLVFNNNPASDFTNLLTFLGVVIGITYNFTFTDYDGATYTARIINSDDLQSSPIATERESFTIELLIES